MEFDEILLVSKFWEEEGMINLGSDLDQCGLVKCTQTDPHCAIMMLHFY